MAMFLVMGKSADGIIKNQKRPRPSPAGPFLVKVRLSLARATERRSAVSGRRGGRCGWSKLLHGPVYGGKALGRQRLNAWCHASCKLDFCVANTAVGSRTSFSAQLI